MRKNQIRYALLLQLIAVIIFLLSLDCVLAANKTWNGNTNSDWNLESNWDDTVPADGDKAIIPTGLTTYPLISSGIITVKDITQYITRYFI